MARDAAVASHEMGHNFGMQHDDPNVNGCPASGFIMNSVLSVTPTQWSSCSKTYLTNYLTTSGVTCLDNVPTFVWGTPVCGDGIVQTGEVCDCGMNCANSCCNGTSCQLLPTAECDQTEACCDPNNCQIMRNNQTCRPAQAADCDLPEFCDGVSASCPSDRYLGAGTPCDDGLSPTGGACLLGRCVSLDQTCTGATTTFADGPYPGCSFDRLPKGADFCTTMYCDAGTDCRFISNSGTPIPTADGIICSRDSSKQCLNRKCTRSSTLHKNYFWKPTAWEPCDSCSAPQTRNVTCQFQDQTSTPLRAAVEIGREFCAPRDLPLLTQVCDNVTLGCSIGDNSLFGSGSDVDFFGVTMAKAALILSALGILALVLAVLACCYRSVTFDDSPPPNARIRRVRGGNQPQRIQQQW